MRFISCGAAAFLFAAAVVMARWGGDDPMPPGVRYVEPGVTENRNPEALPAGAVARLGPQRFRHDSNLTGGQMVAFTADGKLLATAANSRLRLWELPTGKFLYEYCDPMTNISNPVISPDGRWLVACGDRPFLFDLTSRKVVRQFGEKNDLPMCISPDGRQLVVQSGRELVWWDYAKGEVTRRWPLPEDFRGMRVQFVESGTQLLIMSWYPRTRAQWREVPSGKVLGERSYQHPQRRTAGVSPDGKYLAVVPYSRESVQIYDMKTGEKVRDLSGPLSASRYGLTFSPDGRTLLTDWYEEGEWKYTVSLWDFPAGTLKQRFGVPMWGGHYTFLPDGRTLLIGDNSCVHLWDVAAGRAVHEETAHTDSVYHLRFSPDGKSLYSSGRELLRWGVETCKVVRQYPTRRGGGFVLTPGGKEIVFNDASHSMYCVETATGKELHRLTATKEPGAPGQPGYGQLTLAPDGQSYFVRLGRGQYQFNGQQAVPGWFRWEQVDVRTGEVLWRSGTETTDIGARLLRDGRTLLRVKYDTVYSGREPGPGEKAAPASVLYTYVFSDLKSGRPRRVIPQPDHSTNGMELSPRGETLATVTFRQLGRDERGYHREKYMLRLWEPATGKQRLTVPMPEASVLGWFYGRYIFSPDGRRVALFRSDGVIEIWDAVTGEQLWKQATGRTQVYAAAFSPDGKLLATGHADTVILLWDVGGVRPKQFATEAGEAELAAWWRQLAGDDAHLAYLAVWRLADAGPAGTRYLAERLEPAGAVDVTPFARWIGELDHKDFKVRDAAMQRLREAGEAAEPVLEQALKAATSPEQRGRLEKLWQQPVVHPPATLQALRALEVLEHQGTAEALAVVRRLAGSEAGGVVQRRAEEVLRRWR